jgi:3',5'-cyclic-AMP phosphodiesterase
MTHLKTLFTSKGSAGEGIVSWVHFGDLNMTTPYEENYHDFLALIEEVNSVMANSLSFVFFPGDNADHGRAQEYEAVRFGLDQLSLPYVSIVGDHDVRTGSFDNYLHYMMPVTDFSFVLDSYIFVALNAFATADSKRFDVSKDQLQWTDHLLARAAAEGLRAVIFLHCYPSDLRKSAHALEKLIRKYGVLLVDMGHTHYNEIANDGKTLYTATRSTGHIEEGPVGFSVTNLDGGAVSWRFFELGLLPAVMITSPSDERLMTDADLSSLSEPKSVRVRAKIWHYAAIRYVGAQLPGQQVELQNVPGTRLWEGEIPTTSLAAGVYPLYVYAVDDGRREAEDTILLRIGNASHVLRKRAKRDRDNAIGAWPEHGLLGTQLGPNKNGRKW